METPPPRKRIKRVSIEKSEESPSQSGSSRIRKKHIIMFTGYDDPQVGIIKSILNKHTAN